MRSMATQTEVNGRATYRHSMPITAEDLLYPPRPVEMVSAEVQTNGGLGQPPPPINTNNAPLNQLPSASRLPGMYNLILFRLLRLSILGPLPFVKKKPWEFFWFVLVNLHIYFKVTNSKCTILTGKTSLIPSNRCQGRLTRFHPNNKSFSTRQCRQGAGQRNLISHKAGTFNDW